MRQTIHYSFHGTTVHVAPFLLIASFFFHGQPVESFGSARQFYKSTSYSLSSRYDVKKTFTQHSRTERGWKTQIQSNNIFQSDTYSDAVSYFQNQDGSVSWGQISNFLQSTALGQKAAVPSVDETTLLNTLLQPFDVFQNLNRLMSEVTQYLSGSNAGFSVMNDMNRLFHSLQEFFLVLPVSVQAALIFGPLFSALFMFLYRESFPPDDFRSGYEPYARGQYDPVLAREYYAKHPRIVLRRMLQLFRLGNRYLFNILLDKYIFRDEELQRPKRAQEVLALIQKAGPTAIKVGQALSVRPDLIPAEYSEALSTLQDRVPPFPSAKAKDILQKELGFNILSRIKEMDLRDKGKGPVASASIGQVYRGTASCRDGSLKEVAVKVQRPDVLAEIALDLFIVREFLAPLQQAITGAATDFQGLANEWGRGFIAELDYNQEAANTIKFNTEIKKRNLLTVTAPEIVEEFCTERVLVTEWVRGTRLDQSTASDVPRLCGVALNAYLVMLLEMSFLHCDPHPGNLLRTEDGKLCILDFGMTLETDPSLQYSLLEFVAHLTSDSYEQIPDDLVKLGFLKADRLDMVRASGFLQPLTYILKQARQGGGGTKVRERIFAEYRERFPGLSDDDLRVQMRDDMQARMKQEAKKASAVSGITMEVEELQKRNRDAFKIPEWFLYTSRAFLTLEGIGLQADPNYSIIQSCFPYIARRLLGDDSVRAQSALKDLLYGASDVIDTKRLSELADGFTTYTKSTKIMAEGSKLTRIEPVARNIAPIEQSRQLRSRAETEASITLVKDSADLLLAPSGNLVQNLLISETSLYTSAAVKDAVRNVVIDGPQRLKESLPFNIGVILPPLPFLGTISPFLSKTKEEIKAQELISKISGFLSRKEKSMSPTEKEDPVRIFTTLDGVDAEEVALIVREVRTNFPKYAPLVQLLGSKYAKALLEVASSNIDSVLGEEQDSTRKDDVGTQFIKAAARNISNAASREAERLGNSLMR